MEEKKSNIEVMKMARKIRSEKIEREKAIREKMAIQLQEKPKNNNLPSVLLPEIYNKVVEVAKYIEENLNSNHGLTTTQIIPLIAKKSIQEIATSNVSATYTPQELAIAFNYYVELIAEINKHTKFIPSKITFCQLLGISTTTYKNYLLDKEKSEIMQIIDDYIANSVITSAQLGEIKEISSIFVNKSQHAWQEETTQNVVYEHKISLEDMKKQFNALKKDNIREAKYKEK